MPSCRAPLLIAACCLALAGPRAAMAGNSHPGTPALMGQLGLNVVPDARVDPAGTVRLQTSTLDPYAHGSLGVQVSRRLYINVRQTAQAGSLLQRADRLLPGIDLKYLLLSETAIVPAIAVGWQGAAGDRRMAGEYLAFSKRFNKFDFTGGLSWGRLATRSHLSNPLAALFGHHRSLDSDKASGPSDWFSGDHMGLFGGVAYDTPVDGLTLKADWSADGYRAERDNDPGYKAPASWSAGFSYSPRQWVSIGAAMAGTHKAMATISFQAPVGAWPGRPSRDDTTSEPFPAYRAGLAQPPSIDLDANSHGMTMESVMTDAHTISSRTMLAPGPSLPQQIGGIVRPMAAHGGAETDVFEIQPTILGLSGASLKIMRRDLEQDLAFNRGSPQEIWRHAQFGPAKPDNAFPKDRTFMERPTYLGLVLDTKASLSEQDHGLLYRTGLVGDYKRMLTRHVISGQSVRLNIADNLAGLNTLRPVSILPVRGDEDRFARRRISIERSYLSWMHSYNSWHAAVTGGYLEEMYGGLGGEILYRPFGKTYAFGAEMWEALKRTPDAAFNLGFSGDHLLTGHLKAWYEVPGTDMTLQAKVGRYLAEDIGGTLSLSNSFRNGASVEAFVTATDRTDASIYGGTTQLYSGLRFRMPLGNLPLVPSGAEARFTVAPIGRDSGQSIDNPLPLYELTEPMSYRHIASHWTELH